MSEQEKLFEFSPTAKAGYLRDPNDPAYRAAFITGSRRRSFAEDRLRRGEEYEDLLWPSLDHLSRRALAAIHTDLVRGEYLPALLPGEIEIARMQFQRPIPNVLSFRVRGTEDDGLIYRIVDDYYDARPLSLEFAVDSPKPLAEETMLRISDAIRPFSRVSEFYFNTPPLQVGGKAAGVQKKQSHAAREKDLQPVNTGGAIRPWTRQEDLAEYISRCFRFTDVMRRAHQHRKTIQEYEAEEAVAHLFEQSDGQGILLLAMTYDPPITWAATRALLRVFCEMPRPHPRPITRRGHVDDLESEFILWMFKGRERELMLALRNSPYAADREVYRRFYDQAARAVWHRENRYQGYGAIGGLAFSITSRIHASLLHGPPEAGFSVN